MNESTYFVDLKEDNTDKCKPNPCKHGGECTLDYNFVDGYRCSCIGDFGGIDCDSKYIVDTYGGLLNVVNYSPF